MAHMADIFILVSRWQAVAKAERVAESVAEKMYQQLGGNLLLWAHRILGLRSIQSDFLVLHAAQLQAAMHGIGEDDLW